MSWSCLQDSWAFKSNLFVWFFCKFSFTLSTHTHTHPYTFTCTHHQTRTQTHACMNRCAHAASSLAMPNFNVFLALPPFSEATPVFVLAPELLLSLRVNLIRAGWWTSQSSLRPLEVTTWRFFQYFLSITNTHFQRIFFLLLRLLKRYFLFCFKAVYATFVFQRNDDFLVEVASCCFFFL